MVFCVVDETSRLAQSPHQALDDFGVISRWFLRVHGLGNHIRKRVGSIDPAKRFLTDITVFQMRLAILQIWRNEFALKEIN